MASDTHGTKAGYDTHRRRGTVPCDECKTAKAAHERRMRRLRAERLEDLPHPSVVAYDSGCRCWPCKDLKRTRDRDYRARVKAGAA